MSGAKPTIFIATKRKPDDVKKRFEPLLERFDIILDPDVGKRSAEFWVVDLSMLPKNPQRYVVDRTGISRAISIASPQFPAPCLFVILDEGLQEDAHDMLEYARDQLSGEPMVANGVDELKRHLMWLWCMFPYQQLPPELQSRIFVAAIDIQRLNQGVQQ
jgi:hypothetical protein